MSWKKGDLSLAYATSFGSSGQLIGLILPFLSIISPIPMPILIDPKYLVMLHMSWIVPLTIAYLKLHSVNMGVFMSLIYVACAVVSYVNVSENVAHH
jgi:Ca2+/Na+ antiporter